MRANGHSDRQTCSRSTAGIAPGGCGIEQHPERFPAAPADARCRCHQLADRAEQADEGDAGPQREHRPGDLGGGAYGRHRQHPGHAACDPVEGTAPQRLRAGMATPDASGQVGQQCKPHRHHGQHPDQHADVAWPQRPAKQVEAPCVDVQQHGLVALPSQPRQGIEQGQHEHAERAAPTPGAGGLRGHPSGSSSSSSPGMGRCRYQVTALDSAVTVQNMKKPAV